MFLIRVALFLGLLSFSYSNGLKKNEGCFISQSTDLSLSSAAKNIAKSRFGSQLQEYGNKRTLALPLRHAKSFGLETAQCDADDPTNCGYLRFVHARIRSNSYLRGGGRNRPKSHGKQRAAVHDSSNVDEHEMSHNSDEEELEDVDNDCDEGHSGGVGDDDEEEEEEEEEEEDGPVERSELVEVDSNGDPLHTQTDRKVNNTLLYSFLGLEPGANSEEIKQAFKRIKTRCRKSRKSTAAHEELQKAEQAFEVLKDPEKREYYDKHGDAMFEQDDDDDDDDDDEHGENPAKNDPEAAVNHFLGRSAVHSFLASKEKADLGDRRSKRAATIVSRAGVSELSVSEGATRSRNAGDASHDDENDEDDEEMSQYEEESS
eukprot:CAMPEP_0113671634 /NCGR_PEP_ID=MMETSP0038_2-20120614/5811_1 /TAXON_ID=2898 /ORGANISM="Cryptomonas paramecium" /LENGTH=373 /DNA_ID=CAMNT_0000587803 /DNA_START=40 /DNA_END=1161 /DNA_ORIENTATION=- /assembly_acc=CAM_ASM_000170